MADYLAKVEADDPHVSGLVQQVKKLQMAEQQADEAQERERGADIVTLHEPEPDASDTAATTSDVSIDERNLVVAVGSKNPVKVEATRRAFQSVFKDMNIVVVRTLGDATETFASCREGLE